MKSLLIGALLISAPAHADICSPHASSPCTPADLRKSNGPIITAIKAGFAAKARRDKESALAKHAKNDEERLTHWTLERNFEEQMRNSFNEAIRLTQDGYHLAPTMPDDPRAQTPTDSAGRWIANIKAPWSVEFQLSSYRVIAGADGSSHYVSDDPAAVTGAAGTCDPDGKATVFLGAFQWSAQTGDPGILAAAIHHETIHYRELITSGWTTHEEGEIHAFKASLAVLETLIQSGTLYGVDIRSLFRNSYQAQIASNSQDLAAGQTHSPFPDAAQEAANKKAFEKQSQRENDFHVLARLVEKRKQEERDRVAAVQREVRWQKFRIWTLYACQYIDGVHESDPEWGHPDQIRSRDDSFRSYLRNNLVVMAKDEIDAGLKRNDLFHGGSIGTCQQQVVEMIRDLPGPVDADWMLSRIEYERNGGRPGEIISGVINSIHRAVLNGSAAIVEIISAPFAADRSAGGGSGGEGAAGGDRQSRHPDIDKLPWQQLRGISAGGWKD